MDKLLQRSAAGWSGVLDTSPSLVIPLTGIQFEECCDGVAHNTKIITERLQLFVEAFTLDFIGSKLLGSAFKSLPLASQGLDHLVWRIFQVHDGCAGDEDVDLVLEVAVALRQCREHLASSLRVSHVRELAMASGLEHEIDLGRQIVFAQFIETVVKELLILLGWIQVVVLATVPVTSVVTKPDIETCLSHPKGS